MRATDADVVALAAIGALAVDAFRARRALAAAKDAGVMPQGRDGIRELTTRLGEAERRLRTEIESHLGERGE